MPWEWPKKWQKDKKKRLWRINMCVCVCVCKVRREGGNAGGRKRKREKITKFWIH